MKKFLCLPLVLLAAVSPLLQAGDSKRTAEYLYTTPSDFEGKDVTVDVAFVKPTPWKSPIPELAFFHALTVDREDYKFGGGILVAVPAADSAKFAKKYGTDFEGRRESNSLKGTFIAAPGRGGPRVWMIDLSGKASELIKERKLELQDEGGDFQPGPGFGGPGGPGHHPRKPMGN